MRGELRALVAGTVALLLLGLFVALRMRVATDITHFLPDGAPTENVHLARELASSELSRTMVLLVDAAETDVAVRASHAFERALRAEPSVGPELTFLDAGPPVGIEDALWQIYQPHRFAFLADDAEAARERLTPSALTAAAVHLKERLALPISSMLSRVAPGDPLLVLPAMFERLIGGRGVGLRIVDGRFVTEDGKAAVLFLATRASSSDGAAQRPILQGIAAAFASLQGEFGDALQLSQSGANRFAVRTEASIRDDIQRVSIGSMVGLLVLFLVLFRSLRLVLLVLPVVTAGFLAGTAACLLLFDEIHGLTLAFGAAMIGVSVDYAVHFHCHHVLAPSDRGPRGTLRGIWPGLMLGAGTTIVGFVALMVSAFPGLRQLAVFGAVGIAAALCATSAFLPGLAARHSPATGASRWLATALRRLLSPPPGRRALLLLPTIAVVVCAAFGLPRMRWNDGIADLSKMDPQLVAADQAVRDRVVRYEQRRLVVAVGADEEAALIVNDGVARVLAAAERDAVLGGWRSVATLVPSAAKQRAVDAAMRDDPELWQRLSAAMVAEGFRAEAFEPFREALALPPPAPLRLADFTGTALEPLVRPFRIAVDSGSDSGIDRGIVFVSFLHDVRDETKLREALAAVPGASLIDIERTLSAAYGAYRERMMWLWLIGLGAVLLLVVVRHRALRPTLIAYLPAALAATGTAGLLALCGLPLNMLSLVALLMIVSMGVDYGVFMAENHGEVRSLDATHLGVFTAGLSTMLGFGLLAISDQPALFSIGLTSGVGVLFSLVLAPTISAFLARPNPT